MPRKFHRHEAVGRALRAIATSEIKVARRASADAAADEKKAVHDVRRQLKRLRALIRLARGGFDDYAHENKAFRDLGRRLSGAREAEVLGSTYDAVVVRAGLDPPAALRRLLLEGHADAGSGALADTLARDIVPVLEDASARVGHWRFDRKGFSLIGAGAHRTYRQMRDAGLEARLNTSAASLHEWRKQVKYHAAQLQYLSPVAPEMLVPRRRTADQLADLLGEHHDLDQLRAALDRLDMTDEQRHALVTAIEARCGELETEAFQHGDDLAGDDPEQFAQRLAGHWRAWRR